MCGGTGADVMQEVFRYQRKNASDNKFNPGDDTHNANEERGRYELSEAFELRKLRARGVAQPVAPTAVRAERPGGTVVQPGRSQGTAQFQIPRSKKKTSGTALSAGLSIGDPSQGGLQI